MRDRTTQSLPLRRHVRDEIQRRILSGESLPGERLPQQSLARKLGVDFLNLPKTDRCLQVLSQQHRLCATPFAPVVEVTAPGATCDFSP